MALARTQRELGRQLHAAVLRGSATVGAVDKNGNTVLEVVLHPPAPAVWHSSSIVVRSEFDPTP